MRIPNLPLIFNGQLRDTKPKVDNYLLLDTCDLWYFYSF